MGMWRGTFSFVLKLGEGKINFMRGGAPQAHGALLTNDTGNARGREGEATEAGRPQGTLLANDTGNAIGHGTRKGCHYYDTNASACEAVSW
jgi:hypothetical protein